MTKRDILKSMLKKKQQILWFTREWKKNIKKLQYFYAHSGKKVIKKNLLYKWKKQQQKTVRKCSFIFFSLSVLCKWYRICFFLKKNVKNICWLELNTHKHIYIYYTRNWKCTVCYALRQLKHRVYQSNDFTLADANKWMELDCELFFNQ